jgi:hypothetical protein
MTQLDIAWQKFVSDESLRRRRLYTDRVKDEMALRRQREFETQHFPEPTSSICKTDAEVTYNNNLTTGKSNFLATRQEIHQAFVAQMTVPTGLFDQLKNMLWHINDIDPGVAHQIKDPLVFLHYESILKQYRNELEYASVPEMMNLQGVDQALVLNATLMRWQEVENSSRRTYVFAERKAFLERDLFQFNSSYRHKLDKFREKFRSDFNKHIAVDISDLESKIAEIEEKLARTVIKPGRRPSTQKQKEQGSGDSDTIKARKQQRQRLYDIKKSLKQKLLDVKRSCAPGAAEDAERDFNTVFALRKGVREQFVGDFVNEAEKIEKKIKTLDGQLTSYIDASLKSQGQTKNTDGQAESPTPMLAEQCIGISPP